MKVGDYVRTKYGEICKLNNIIYQDDNYIQYQLGGRLEDKDFLKLLNNDITTPIIDEYDNSKTPTNFEIYQSMNGKSNEDLAVYYVVTQDENAVKLYF